MQYTLEEGIAHLEVPDCSELKRPSALPIYYRNKQAVSKTRESEQDPAPEVLVFVLQFTVPYSMVGRQDPA